MQLETIINKLLKFLRTRLDSLSMSVTSGGVDNMENYKYIIGQINAYEATLQEISNLLEDCLLYTSPSPRDGLLSRMPSSA